MDPLTIILTNAAITAYNSWQSNRNNQKLQEKQRAFLKAAEDRKDKLMWNLMRESQEISLQMEYDLQQQRIEELEKESSQFWEKAAEMTSINTWPLRVLPIVMKNQSLGDLVVKKNVNIAMHCIVTPSNCESFNQMILPVIDRQLEDYFNEYWSPLSNHTVIFYGDAWNAKTCPTGTEIRQLKDHIGNLPTLIIIPYFKNNDSGIVFRLYSWGMGYDFKVGDIVPRGFSYQGDTYNKKTDFVTNEELRNTTIEDFTPYLQCLISYFADQYFWNGFGVTPQLLNHLESGIISTDGQLHLLELYRSTYQGLTNHYLSEKSNVRYRPDNCLKLCTVSSDLRKSAKTVIKSYCETVGKDYFESPTEFVEYNSFRREEFGLLDALIPFVGLKLVNQKKSEYWDRYHKDKPRFVFEKKSLLKYTDLLNYGKENIKLFPEADSYELLFFDKDFTVLCFFSRQGHVEHNDEVGVKGYLSSVLYVPHHLEGKNHIILNVSELDYRIYESETDMKALEIANLLNRENANNESNENQEIVNKFRIAKEELINEIEQQYLTEKSKEEDVLIKVKESFGTAFELTSSTITETMDETIEKFTPMLNDVKGKIGSCFRKKK